MTYNFTNPSAKLYNREIGGLLKAAARTRCNRLTLIVMEGNTGEVSQDGYTVRILKASDWLVS